MQPFRFDEGDEWVTGWSSPRFELVLELVMREEEPKGARSSVAWDQKSDFFEVLGAGHLGYGCRRALKRPGAP